MSTTSIDWLELFKLAIQSPLGIVGLVVMLMSFVAITLFRKSSDHYRFAAFIVLVLGVSLFSYTSVQLLQPAKDSINKLAVESLDSFDGDIVDDVLSDTEIFSNMPSDSKSTDSEAENIVLEEGYIYLGTYRDGSWKDARFENATSALSVGDKIEISQPRKMFDREPYRKFMLSLKYTFSDKVTGDVGVGQIVEVLEPPKSVGLNRVWVYVKKVSQR
jgi:hypothetical protein